MEPMAIRNHTFFLTALVLTLVIHLLAINPISKWLSKEILPALTDESLVIDLSEIKAHTSDSSNKTKIETRSPQEAPLDPKEKPKKDTLQIPKTKINLDPSLTEDRILSPEQQSNVPSSKTVAKEEKVADEIKEKAQSPVFIRKPEAKPEEKKETVKKQVIPEDIKKTFRNDSPEKTDDEKMEYSINSYKWTFQRYVGNWVVDIQKWWKAPLDYAMGRVPEGGDMWIEVKIAKSGKLLGYRIKGSNVSAEMELMVIQALVGSLARPPLPDSFPEDWLLINWHFIYPPIRPQLRMRR